MPAADRAPYVQQAQADKARHEAEMATFEPDPSMLKPTKGGKSLQKDPMRPKKPKSAYLYFGEATRAELTASNPSIRACSRARAHCARRRARASCLSRIPRGGSQASRRCPN